MAKRAEKLQASAEKVRQVNPDANKGLAKLAGENSDGNPKLRDNSWGVPTKSSKK
jgi:hypothetical protein